MIELHCTENYKSYAEAKRDSGDMCDYGCDWCRAVQQEKGLPHSSSCIMNGDSLKNFMAGGIKVIVGKENKVVVKPDKHTRLPRFNGTVCTRTCMKNISCDVCVFGMGGCAIVYGGNGVSGSSAIQILRKKEVKFV